MHAAACLADVPDVWRSRRPWPRTTPFGGQRPWRAPSCWRTRRRSRTPGRDPGPRGHGVHVGGARCTWPTSGPSCWPPQFGTADQLLGPGRRPGPVAGRTPRPRPIGAADPMTAPVPAPPADVVAPCPEGPHRLRDAAAHPVPVDPLRGRVGEGGRSRRAGPGRSRGGRSRFFSLGVGDHTAIPRRLSDAMGTIWYDTDGDARMAGRGHHPDPPALPGLVLAHRHPLRAAKELSTVDVLSGGRLIVGVGAGYVPEEYELLTGGFEERGAPHRRGAPALVRCFAEEFPDLPGPRWPARDMGLAPGPVRRPALPSGSAVRPRPPCGGPPPSATDGCPRRRRP